MTEPLELLPIRRFRVRYDTQDSTYSRVELIDGRFRDDDAANERAWQNAGAWEEVDEITEE